MMRILNEEFLVAMVEEEVRNTILRGEREREIKHDNKDNTDVTVWDIKKNQVRFL